MERLLLASVSQFSQRARPCGSTRPILRARAITFSIFTPPPSLPIRPHAIGRVNIRIRVSEPTQFHCPSAKTTTSATTRNQFVQRLAVLEDIFFVIAHAASFASGDSLDVPW